MKLVKILACIGLITTLGIGNVMANTYTNGSVIENELGYIEVPEDSSYIKFTLPQGTYPEGSKAVVYAQSNVFCFVPGLEYKEPTADANPYKLAAEYVFTENDITSLENGPTTFTTTLKFDIMCGGIRVVITGGSEKPNNNLVEDNREQGSTESDKGVKLDVYSDGSTFESNVKLVDNVVRFIIPQGSYTLGDYIVVTKDDKVLANITISKAMMETLVNANIEYSMIVDLEDTDNIKFMVSSYMFDIGDELETEEDPSSNNENPGDVGDTPSQGMNPLVFGLLAFLVVLGGGLGYMKFTNKKKASSDKNEVVIYESDEAHQIEDNRIIEAETSEKEVDDSEKE
ncbi:MAG: hypothetical protein IKM20_03610 [Erysipelotrichales bacterium]|nr:hypothetical protein [Erysipelotrichales bacterium]